MSFVALHNVLHDDIMQKRFHRDPLIKAVEILLQERAVQNAPLIEVSREEAAALLTRLKAGTLHDLQGIGSGIENWFPYALALLFLLVRPAGLFGERAIERI